MTSSGAESGVKVWLERAQAQGIVILAVGLVIGAVALAMAPAFGLGGRELAARDLERWPPSRTRPRPEARLS